MGAVPTLDVREASGKPDLRLRPHSPYGHAAPAMRKCPNLITIGGPMLSHIDHIVLTVRDIPRAVEFYTRVLGMQAVSFAGGRTALSFGQQKINLQTLGMETRNFAGIGSGDLCLILDWPLDKTAQHLAEQNVPIVEGPVQKTGATGPIMSIYINDPDGNLIELSEQMPQR